MERGPYDVPPVQYPNLKHCFVAAFFADLTIGALLGLSYLLGLLAPYGVGLFVLVPFFAGLAGGAFLGRKGRRRWDEVLISALFAVILPSISLLFVGAEGLACVVMALPIAYALVIGGFATGRTVFSGPDPTLTFSGLALLPFLLFLEARGTRTPTPLIVTTTITIDAPAERIWPYLQNLDSIRPDNWLLRTGVAHPKQVRTEGSGVGAARHCVLSTGDMPEKIDVWEPPRRLRFQVTQTPPSMRELNPFREVKAAHLTGYFECLQGEFVLKPDGQGRTVVVGISHVQHRYAPAWYWSIWSKSIVRSVQGSVLDEVKRRAEASRQSIPANL